MTGTPGSQDHACHLWCRKRGLADITSPFASQVIRAVEQVKKPDHWPREFAKSVKERQKSSLEEVHVKSQVLYVCSLTSPAWFFSRQKHG
jgi:hypothetical protein